MTKIKLIICLLLLTIIGNPRIIFASSFNNFKIIEETEKYYKTIVYQDLVKTVSNNNLLSYTTEISLEEYLQENQKNAIRSSTTGIIETTYKKLKTTISTNGSYYRYKAILYWKNMPKIRSYDTIAIGHYASVTQKGNLYFSQQYCTSTTNCITSNSFTQQKFNKGASATFKLPSGNFISLKQTLYFDVKKNVDATIIRQIACADYSHATSSISSSNALNLSVNDSGIILDSSISNYYDEISSACATWNGTW